MARPQTTRKYDIIKTTSEFFFTVGFSNTSPKMIAEKLNISPGNITYYFPSKEHLLCTIVEMLCDFQWKMFGSLSQKGYGSISAICMEMMTVATGCETSEIARDFFTAVFESEMCRNYLRKNHVERSKHIFAQECAGWTHQQFEMAELMVMGLQHSTVAANDTDIPLEVKIPVALDHVLDIYQVDEEVRKREINKIMNLDYRAISPKVISEFLVFIEKVNKKSMKDIRENMNNKK